jgi:hypothetical protein
MLSLIFFQCPNGDYTPQDAPLTERSHRLPSLSQWTRRWHAHADSQDCIGYASGENSCWFLRLCWMPPWTEMSRLFMEFPRLHRIRLWREFVLVPEIVLDAAVDRDVTLVHGPSCHYPAILN